MRPEQELPKTISPAIGVERDGSRPARHAERRAPVRSRRATPVVGARRLARARTAVPIRSIDRDRLRDLAWLPLLGHIAPRAPQIIPVDRERTLELDRGRIRYESTGDRGDAVVFLHGFHSQLAVWNDVWPHVARCERRIRLDLPGYGGSRWRSDSYALPLQGERVLRLLDALGIARVTLVGVSMGGSLAAWLAGTAPERVRGLVLLAPSGYPGALRYRGAFGTLLRSGGARRRATQLAASPLYRWLYPSSQALQALTVTASYDEAWVRALARIRVHAWILWSRGDATVPFEFATRVARAIPASTLLPLAPDVGHDIPGKRPELIGRLACRVHEGEAPAAILRRLRDDLQRKGDR